MAVVAGLIVWTRIQNSRAVFDAKVAELRAAGYATTLEESWADAPPDEQNAAFEIEAAWADLVAERGTMSSWGVTGPWDYTIEQPWHETAGEARLAALAQFLDEIHPFFNRVEAASKLPAIWFREERGADVLAAVEYIRLLQDVHRVLEAQMIANRDPRRRLAAAMTGLRIAATKSEQGLVPRMVRSVYAAAALRTVRELVTQGRLPASEVRATCDDLLRAGDLPRFQGVVRSEIPQMAGFFDGVLRGTIEWPGIAELNALFDGSYFARREPPWPGARISEFVNDALDRDPARPSAADFAEVLERMRGMAELPIVSPPEIHRKLLEGDPDGTPEHWWGHHFLRLLARRDSARALARVALAAAEFREREGRWPETLDALAPMFPEGVPVEPCDGRPFDYAVTGDEVRISARGTFPDVPSQMSEEERLHEVLVWEFVPRSK